MSGPQMEYRGHTIRWSDNEDMWSCWDLSDKARYSPSLTKMKQAIDRLYLAERKQASTQCWEIAHRGVRTEGMVVEYLGSKRIGYSSLTLEDRVAVVARREGSERPSRAERDLSDLAPVGPETDAAWDEFVRLKDAEKQAKIASDKAFNAIPRLKRDDVAKLVALHEADEESTRTQ